MSTRASERGETSVQMAVIAPALFLCIFVVCHVAAYWMSALTASAAATRGARAASVGSRADGSRLNGLTAIEETIHELGADLDQPPRVEVSTDSVLVTVRVKVAAVVPMLPTAVSRTVRMRTEQFIGESGR